ncbi:MAG: restriction endonuclease subunit S [Acidobacteriota bacterium]
MTELGFIPKEWEVVKIEDIGKVITGNTPPKKQKEYWTNGEINFIKPPDLQNGSIITFSEKISKKAENVARITIKGSVLVSCIGILGRVGYTKNKVAFNQQINAVEPNIDINGLFLFYALQNQQYQIENLASFTTVPIVSKAKFTKVKIPLPPLHEQKKIAGVLSAAQEAKEKTEEVIKAAKELKKSLLKHLFTYGPVSIEEAENVKLKETEIGMMPEDWKDSIINKVIEKANHKNPKKDPFKTFRYVDVSSIDRESLKITEYKNYKGKDAPSRARKNIEKDDIIFATVRPTLKRISIIDENFSGEICSTAFCVLRAKKDTIDPRYLFYYVQRDVFMKKLGKIQRGASYPAVTDSDIKNLKISLPPISIQKEIANTIFAIDQKIQAEENKKKALEELFKSLLNNLMTGKIRVNNLDLEL